MSKRSSPAVRRLRGTADFYEARAYKGYNPKESLRRARELRAKAKQIENDLRK